MSIKKIKKLYSFGTPESGLTLIELLIAAVIITVGFLTVVSLSVNSFTRTASLSSNLTASYLTQEGFEVVRRIRDTNFNIRYQEENGNDWSWDQNLLNGDNSITGSLQYDSKSLGNNEDDYLKVASDGFYNYDEGEETTFKREIKIESKNYQYDDDEEIEYILVTIEVSWEERKGSRSYEAQTKLFNWY